MSTIGVIGLGRMGGNMAQWLLENDYEVIGFDIDASQSQRLESAGGRVAESPAAVAESAAVILSSLPDPDTVRAAYFADDGILTATTEDTIGIETSTIDPDTTVAIAGKAREQGMTVIDSPVSGGPEAARDGTLRVIVGAEEDEITGTPAEPVMEALASTVYYVGQRGGGNTVKLVNNVMSMSNLLVALEAMSLAVSKGLDGEIVYDIVRNSGGSSNQFEKRIPRVLNRNFEPGFTVSFSRKDLDLALETADAVDLPMVATSQIHQLYTAAVASGYGEEDCCAVGKVFEQYAGSRIESAEPVDESYGGY